MSWPDPTTALMYLAAGLALGAAYFFLLRRTAKLHAIQAPALRIVPLYLVRIALAVAVFWLIAQRGATPLLIALFGFLLARLAVRRLPLAE